MKENMLKKVIRLSVIASLYVALTYAFGWMSYGDIQFRIAEILVLLCFFRKDYAISLIIGCAIANLMSPLGIVDVLCGTFATALSVIGVMYVKNLYLAGIFPVIFNGIIVGAELSYVYGTPFLLNLLFVSIGELVVMIVGVMIFKRLKKNSHFIEISKANQNV